MTTRSAQPPWEFLLSASKNSLQSFELSRLAYAANLRKQITVMIDQWIDENTAAMLARWLLDQRERATRSPEALSAAAPGSNGAHAVSDNFLADRTVSQPTNGSRS
jgi:hypothetical protein